MDIWEVIITVVATILLQTLLIVFIGNRFLKYAADMLTNIIANPTMRKAFGILGGKSGESRRNLALENEIATSAINKIIGPFKLIITKVLGIDIDEMIEEHGAMEVLNTLQQFLPMLKNAGVNINFDDILKGLTGEAPQTSNTELGKIGS